MKRKNSPSHDGPEEPGCSFYHLQPHRGYGALIKEGGLGQGSQSIQRLLQQLTAEVRVLPWAHTHIRQMRPPIPRQHTQRALPTLPGGFSSPRVREWHWHIFYFPLSSQLETSRTQRLTVNSYSKVFFIFWLFYGHFYFLVLLENKSLLRHCSGLPGMCVCIYTFLGLKSQTDDEVSHFTNKENEAERAHRPSQGHGLAEVNKESTSPGMAGKRTCWAHTWAPGPAQKCKGKGESCPGPHSCQAFHAFACRPGTANNTHGVGGNGNWSVKRHVQMLK